MHTVRQDDAGEELGVNQSTLPPPGTAELRELLCHMDAGFEAEKRSLARQLHGDLGGALTALSMHLTLLQQKLGGTLPDDVALVERLDKMKDLLQSATETARCLQTSLRPEKLDAFGLKAALTDLASAFEETHHCSCRVSLPDEELDYPPDTELILLRIAEEALNNVARHARASHVDLVLDDTDDAIVLTIRDNGRGASSERIEGAGSHGLRLMRERAGYVNGRVRIAPATTAGPAAGTAVGTMVTVNLPK